MRTKSTTELSQSSRAPPSRRKRRDYSFWLTLSFLFPPAVLMLFLMPNNDGARPQRRGMDAQEDHELKRDGADRVF